MLSTWVEAPVGAELQRMDEKCKLLGHIKLIATSDCSLPAFLSMNSPGRSTGVGSHAYPPGDHLPDPELNPSIVHCRQTLPSEPSGSPEKRDVYYFYLQPFLAGLLNFTPRGQATMEKEKRN